MSRKRHAADARAVACRVLGRVAADDAYIAPVLDQELRRAELSERERKLATELCYGVCRHRRRLDRAIASASNRGRVQVKSAVRTILRVAAYQLLCLDRVPAHAAIDRAVEASQRHGGAPVAGFVNGLLRRLARDGEPALPGRDAPMRYAELTCSLPTWIAERLASMVGKGDELCDAARAFGEPAPLAIRVNRTRIQIEELTDRLGAEKAGCQVQSAPWSPDGLLVRGLGDPQSSPSFAEGLWTVQDVGAQLVSHFVGPLGRDERPLAVLDACAGVGGKTLNLDESLPANAMIDAVDISTAKLERLHEAATRLGVANRVRTVIADLATSVPPSAALAAAYDLVLLDAPCTGLGVLRRHPEAKWRVTEADVRTMVKVQRTLLDQLCARVRPGGLLLYSVCTFTWDEGMGQVRGFLERHPEFALQAPETHADDAIPWSELATRHHPGTMATWPHRHQSDAFFVARLRRQASPSSPQ